MPEEIIVQQNVDYDHYNVIEIPINSGQPRLGVSEGSHRIWEEMKHALAQADKKVDHHRIGDVTIDGSELTETIVEGGINTAKNAQINGEANERISNYIINKLSDDSLTVSLGGDHSLALGTVHGHAEYLHNKQEEIAVLWIDAHADINIPAESESGNLHGMPLGFLANGTNQARNPARLPGHTWIKDPRVQMHNLAYIGLRDVDDYERDLLKENDVLAFYMEDVRRLGIKEVMRQAFAKFQLGPTKKLHLSFDIDGMDPSLAPSTGTTACEGLSLDEGLHIVQAVHNKGFVELIDMVEVNPTLGDDEDARKTVGLASLILQVAMGIKSAKKAKAEFLARFKSSTRQTQ